MAHGMARTALLGLLLAPAAACKDPPPKPAAAAKAAAAAGGARPTAATSPAQACTADPAEGLPLFDRPLAGELGGTAVEVRQVEIVPGGLLFRLDAGRIRVPIPRAGKVERSVYAAADRLAGIRKFPAVQGKVDVGGTTIAPPRLRALRLELSPIREGHAEGMITLCFEEPGGYLAGRFRGRAHEDISDRPDRGRDHPSVVRLVVDEHLAGRGVARETYRHSWIQMDPARAWAYDHVIARPIPPRKRRTPGRSRRPTPPWPSRTFVLTKKDGAWTVAHGVAGDRIPEAVVPPGDDPAAAFGRAAARAVEEKLGPAKPGGFASRVRVQLPSPKGGAAETGVQRAVVTVTLRPDPAGRTKPPPLRFRVAAERRDGGVRVTKVERVSGRDRSPGAASGK